MSDFNQGNELPIGWEMCTLSDVSEGDNGIVDGPFGSNLKISDYIDDSANGVPVLTTKNLEGDYSDKAVRFISKAKFEGLKRSQVNPGDILVAKIGSIGKTGIYPKNGRTAIIPANLLKFTVSKQIAFGYVFSYLNSLGLQQKIKAIATATAQPAFNVTKFRFLEMPLPPIAEQHRIVAKIEELFSSLNKGIESLKTAQQQLKVYRQAVLKWAFEGKLTNKNVVDGELPEGWKWKNLGEVADKITDGEHFRPKTQKSGIPFLSAKDVKDEGVSFDEPLFISEVTAKKAMQRCNPQKGDILIVSRGATVGRMCIVRTDNRFCLLGSVILIQVKSELNSQYLTYALKSPIINEKMISVSGATAQQAIYLRDIKSVKLPISPLSEQTAIVAEIESRLSVCDKIEESIEQSLKQAECLRQSILKKAFEGKLVSQDPNDEPASLLLARIKAERERHKPENPPHRQTRKARTKKAAA